MSNGEIGFYYDQRKWDWNHTIGKTAITSAFVLLDFEFSKSVRFNGGLRMEKVNLFSDVYQYDLLGYERNDGRRVNVAGYPMINPGIIDKVNFLPSGSLIYKLASKKNTSNLRLNFSQTVARPNLREMNDAAVYDNEFRTLIYGNSNLKMTEIYNYDFRFENFFKNGDNISVSAFYKDFTNHIEMGFGSSGITWDNNENSYVAGIELEGRKKIGDHFEFRSNVTLVKSYSQFVRKELVVLPNNQSLYIPIDTVERTMFGQAPYIVNGILSYSSDTLGLTATLSYNVQGPRLVLTGILKGRPDVYEMPRNTIDIKVSKTLGDHFSMSFTVRDLLNAPVRRAYKTPNGYVDYDRFRYGANYQIGLSYKL
jgi:outer membrane receptor protein involved in Fe transport